MTIALFILAALLLIAALLVARLYQAHRQHRQLIEFIDAFAEMVGEAIERKEQ